MDLEKNLCFLTYLNVIFDLDADASEDSSPPLPERTPESFVLASEQSTPLLKPVLIAQSEWSMLCDQHLPEQTSSTGLKTTSPILPDRPERSNKTPTDILPQISFSGSTDTRGQIPEFPAEVTDIELKPCLSDLLTAASLCEPVLSQQTEVLNTFLSLGFGNRCAKPRGPREPPSEWT
ncbi:hypothetical protein IHE44_0012590 [Lamprotornis superbus]|uniref:protein-tyrosine-phosphatase n=1 Tax=Lamprotornis superbus TaxID=245042 RepID=A0A835P301_9PASS|nr:hypothetical protein IHE44_0012590 [Lamprotornis superbus]